MFRRLRDSGRTVTVLIDGRPFAAAPGDTVAAALLLAGIERFRLAARTGMPRGPYCGMGACFECLVTIDGEPNRQACLTPVREGLVITTGTRAPALAPGTKAAP